MRAERAGKSDGKTSRQAVDTHVEKAAQATTHEKY
jgi:hypothetical protein